MNLEDVARLAGVSRSTVSRVINNDRRVSERARRRVMEVIQRYEYHPNAAARSLASRRTHILGLLVPDALSHIFSDPFFPKLVQGAIEGCNESGNNLMMLMDTPGATSVNQMYRRVVRGRHLDAIVVASSVVNDPVVARLRKDGYPFVLVGRHPRFEDTSFVDTDNREGARQAVSHLLGHGHRRIAFIGGPENMIAAMDRYDGYASALSEAGAQPDPELVVFADFTYEAGYLAMRSLLPRRPEAVFAASDLIALGAYRALREAGVRVPDDVAVFGFDDLDAARVAEPPLSSVTQHPEELGREAVRIALRLLEHPDGAVHEVLPVPLAIRRSCGCEEAEGAGALPRQPGVQLAGR